MSILETVFLSLTGAVAGMLLSLETISYFGRGSINISIISEGINAFGYNSMVYPRLGFAVPVFEKHGFQK
ncbi:MAG: hypothetical protein ABI416_04270 [Ginsengibacter sp.]